MADDSNPLRSGSTLKRASESSSLSIAPAHKQRKRDGKYDQSQKLLIDRMNEVTEQLGLRHALPQTGDEKSKWESLFRQILHWVTEVQREMRQRDATIGLVEASDIIQQLDEETFTSWKEMVTKGVRSGEWEDVINHPLLQVSASPLLPARQILSVPPRQDSVMVASRAATVASWNREFVGTANDAFIETLDSHIIKGNLSYYARFISIVQSSGMGKSRMIDEVARKKFVLPVNLRKSCDGYPPADGRLKSYFCTSAEDYDLYTKHCTAFFISLFKNLAKLLNENKGMGPAKFREWLAAGGNYQTPGENRVTFYTRVADDALKISTALEPCTPPSQSRTLKDVPSPKRAFRYPPPSSPSKKGSVQEVNFPAGVPARSEQQFSGTNVIPNVDVSQPMPGLGQPSGEEIIDEFPLLQEATNLLNLIKNETKSPLKLLIAFDEADQLAEAIEGVSWTRLSILQSVLRQLRSFPIFFCALATTGKIQQFTPPPPSASSARLQRSLLKFYPPFSSLGFDQLSKTRMWGKYFKLADVTETEFIVSFGRPLFASRYFAEIEKGQKTEIRSEIVSFAANKLLCNQDSLAIRTFSQDQIFAMISTRVPLEFNAVTEYQKGRENLFVEKHMRVCLAVSPGFESVTTVAASEPLLSAAAEMLMRSFEATEIPTFLLNEWALGGLSKGNRGEIVAALIFLLAGDRVRREDQNNIFRRMSVRQFFSALVLPNHASNIMNSFPHHLRNDEENKTFKESFCNSYMWFNHFVHVEDFLVINRKYLWAFMVRGCAVFCADNQYGVDIIIPIAYKDQPLKPENTSAIFLQVRNRKNYSTPNCHVFDQMNPWDVGMLNAGDIPFPMIRILFSMSSDNPIIKVMKSPERRNPPRKAKEAVQHSKCTTYDIWFGGISAQTLCGVTSDSEVVWKQTLKAARDHRLAVFADKSKTPNEVRLMKAQHPLVSLDDAHWDWFLKIAKDLQKKR